MEVMEIDPLENDENKSDMSDDDCGDTRKLVQQQNRKKKKSGGFQSMGLSYSVYKGIQRKGYKVPTPIQRKCIPLILDGKDVVAMARTGSGKTAAFLIPLFEKLKAHVSTGCRSLILSPTRELALQTLKFLKEIGKFTGLKAAVILGGDSMDNQFAAMHENPDVIIATPGRLMHVLVEMNAKLQTVQYLVFDEADRLFEMGFQEQLHEIIKRLPDNRQTLLFSATLPKLLVEFARAGLHDPTLLRLDVDTKLSENLKLSFLHCRSEDRIALLLYLLQNVVKEKQQTVVFVATKHHVEYLNMILLEAGIVASYTYSALDPTARKINVAKFRNRKTTVLLVTDLAARGIDIPMLDNVINFHFPAKPKLFVHRVGRVARAGRSGTAYSIVTPDEIPFVLDLHLFLGRPLNFVPPAKKMKDTDGLLGRVPQWVMDSQDENLQKWTQKTDIKTMLKVVKNGYDHYIRSRPAPSNESVKRMKKIDFLEIGVHPLFGNLGNDEEARIRLLESMKSYKPTTTIFDVNSTSKTAASIVMKRKRDLHSNVIAAKIQKKQLSNEEKALAESAAGEGCETENSQEMGSDTDIQRTFSKVVAPKSSEVYFDPGKKKKYKKKPVAKDSVKDGEYYIDYKPKDYQSEKGLSVGPSFENEIKTVSFDLTGDDKDQLRNLGRMSKWDRKRKKFVNESGKEANKKKIKTESGQWISASYKKNIYADWLNRSKVGAQGTGNDSASDNDDDQGGSSQRSSSRGRGQGRGRGGRGGRGPGRGSYNPDRLQVVGEHRRGPGFHKKGSKEDMRGGHNNKFKRELKRPEQILKQRRVTAKKEAFEKHRTQKRGGGGGKRGGRGGKAGGSRGRGGKGKR